MELDDLVERYGMPRQVIEAIKKTGITKLYPPQEEALKKGLLEGKNLVLAIPTAAGKTLVAELCMLKSIFKANGRCLYVVPLRALAREKYEEFKQRYEPLGISIGIATGDYDVVDPRLARYQILIATSEKVDSLLRHRAKWLGDALTVVVLDEVHLINDPGRGPTLEMLTARLRQVNPDLQLLALSATIMNSNEIADWLDAELVTSDWRPVPLKEGVYYGRRIRFADASTREVSAGVAEELAALALDTVREGGQALLFVSTRRSAQAVASAIAKHIRDLLTPAERSSLDEVARSVEGALGEPTRTCKRLADCVRQGTAFHHAGLHAAQRRAIEDAFRQNLIKAMAATPTLAAGVNLPARRVVIRDYRRYEPTFGSQFIPVLEYKQMAGRAGRPKYDKYGEAVLVARSEDESEVLFEEFIKAKPERITSKLASEPALRSHVLASIAAGYVTSLKGMLDFIGHTFFAYQYGADQVAHVIERVLDFLKQEDMVRQHGERLVATPFGERISWLYIDPMSGVVLRDGLKRAQKIQPTTFSFLHLICSTPDMELLYPRRRDYSELDLFVTEHVNEFLTRMPDEYSEPEAYEYFLAEVKTALMLQMWIDEAPEDDIHERFGIGAGDIRRAVDTADWLLYSAQELAKLFKIKGVAPTLRDLRKRVRYGVKEELLELIELRGIGRVRGRSLYKAGYRGLADIRKADVKELAQVPHIGPEIAKSIKQQLERGLEGALEWTEV
ncbi:MAG: ATP-dependent DNA helicase [Candidatus Hadarchaeales archaeon]